VIFRLVDGDDVHLIGGYRDIALEGLHTGALSSNDHFKASNKSFLFNLTRCSKHEIIENQSNFAINDRKDAGPLFGKFEIKVG